MKQPKDDAVIVLVTDRKMILHHLLDKAIFNI